MNLHDLPTPAEPITTAEPQWPTTIWLILWTDGDVDVYRDEESAKDMLTYWTRSNPLPLTYPTWPIAIRKVDL